MIQNENFHIVLKVYQKYQNNSTVPVSTQSDPLLSAQYKFKKFLKSLHGDLDLYFTY